MPVGHPYGADTVPPAVTVGSPVVVAGAPDQRTFMTVARAVRRLRASHALRAAARLGLISRGLFYLLLAYLTAALAAGHTVRGSQVNANGALRAVSATPLGLVALAAAVGFAAFGLIRLVGARPATPSCG